jgi:mRNA interferase RelE/StbE
VEIKYTKAAAKALARLSAKTAARIQGKIEQYAADPASLGNNVTKLQGREGYRLRVGDWRVIFEQDGAVLDVLQIGPRGRIYED